MKPSSSPKQFQFGLLLLFLVSLAVAILPTQAQAGPVTFTVTQTADEADGSCSDGDCSLRDAITAANSNGNPGVVDVIVLDDDIYNVTIRGEGEDNNRTGDLDITQSVVIQGGNAGSTLITARKEREFEGRKWFVSALDDRIFHANPQNTSGVEIIFNGVTIDYGGALDNGGGILVNGGTVTFNDSQITNNRARHNGGGLSVSSGTITLNNTQVINNSADVFPANANVGNGGGIWVDSGTVTLNNSTIAKNWTRNQKNDNGGGLGVTSGTVILNSSTIDDNSSNRNGGGIWASGGTVTLNNSTVTDNSSGTGGAIYALGSSEVNISNTTVAFNRAHQRDGTDGIHNEGGQITLSSSLIAQNTSQYTPPHTLPGIDLRGTFTSEGYNLIEDTTTASITIQNQATTDITNVDPRLLEPANLGGSTRTVGFRDHLSPAIDKGNCPASLTTDQRGRIRPVDIDSVDNANGGNGCDIGAFEVQNAAEVFTVTKFDDTHDGRCDTDCSLREAVTAANSNSNPFTTDIIHLPSGTYKLTIPNRNQWQKAIFYDENENRRGDLDITQSVDIRGADQASTIIDSSPYNFTINDGVTIDTEVTTWSFHLNPYNTANVKIGISGVTIRGSATKHYDFGHQYGGAVWITSGTEVTINDIIFTDNKARDYGGAIWVTGGTVAINNSTLINNMGGQSGGAIMVSGRNAAVTVNNSTITGNQADDGGGVYVSNAGTVTINNSTITHNTANDDGGGAMASGNTAQVIINNSTIAHNAAGEDGGGVTSYSGNSLVTINSSTIAHNTADNRGGGILIFNGGTIKVKNSIIAHNTAPNSPNRYSFRPQWIQDQGHNLIGGDIKLLPLGDYGGPTHTFALNADSPALDAGNCAQGSDQRGMARPVDLPGIDNPSGGNGCDIGAFEAHNLPPNANDDNSADYKVFSGDTLAINDRDQGVLANDIDPDTGNNTGLTIVGGENPALALTPPEAGTVHLKADGTFTYIAPATFSGTATFSYRAQDATGAKSNEASGTITISPKATSDSYTVKAGETLTVPAPGVLDNDTPKPGLTIVGGENPALALTPPEAGTVHLKADGTFTYSAPATFSGTATFSYQAEDALGAQSAAATVTITVTNEAPIANPDSNYTVASGNTLTIRQRDQGVLGNDVDPDTGNNTGLTIVGGENATLALRPVEAGTLHLKADGTFTYSAPATFSGTATFSYQAEDALGAQSAAATVTITVTNEAPIANPDSNYTVASGNTLTIRQRDQGVLGNDVDPEMGANTGLTIVGGENATLALRPVEAGTLHLKADGTFTYNAPATFVGTATFSYQAQDVAGGQSISTTATITVSPDAKNDAYSIAAGQTLSIPAPGVLDNDNPRRGLAILNGTRQIQTTKNVNITLNADGSFNYVAPANLANQEDTFEYIAQHAASGLTSRTATVTIRILDSSAINQAPAANDDPNYTVAAGSTLAINDRDKGVLGNDIDPEIQANTGLTIVGGENATLALRPVEAGTLHLKADGTFTYNAPATFAGTATLTYRAQDTAGAQSNEATVTITVTNEAPIANPDSTYTVASGSTLAVNDRDKGVLGNDIDPEIQANTGLTIVGGENTTLALTPVEAGTVHLKADGTFTYSAPATFAGTATFSYQAQDVAGGQSISTTATITVSPDAKNDAYSIVAGQTLSIPAPGVLDNDNPRRGLAILNGTRQIQTTKNVNITLNADGSFNYVAPANLANQEDTFEYIAQHAASGLTSRTATVTIRILDPPPANQAPTANNDPNYTVASGSTLTVTQPAQGVLANDIDPDNNMPLTIVGGENTNLPLTPVEAGSVHLKTDGTFIYNAPATFASTATFTYQAQDTAGAQSNVATVTITVTNSAPPTCSMGNLPVQPTLSWQRPADQTDPWYQLLLWNKTTETIVFDKWVSVNTICTGQSCNLQTASYLPEYGLLNGVYELYIRTTSDGNTFSDWTVVAPHQVNRAAPQLPDVTNIQTQDQGRAQITLPRDDNALYYQVYIGKQDNQQHLQWYRKHHPMCCGNTCTFDLDFYLLNGQYVLYVRAWGPAGLSTGGIQGWGGPFNFEVNDPAPTGATDLNATLLANGKPQFGWTAPAHAPWYNFWVGTISSEGEATTAYTTYLFGRDLKCVAVGQACVFEPDIDLAAGSYSWYVLAIGPGGNATGGWRDTGWVEGPALIKP